MQESIIGTAIHHTLARGGCQTPPIKLKLGRSVLPFSLFWENDNDS